MYACTNSCSYLSLSAESKLVTTLYTLYTVGITSTLILGAPIIAGGFHFILAAYQNYATIILLLLFRIPSIFSISLVSSVSFSLAGDLPFCVLLGAHLQTRVPRILRVIGGGEVGDKRACELPTCASLLHPSLPLSPPLLPPLLSVSPFSDDEALCRF